MKRYTVVSILILLLGLAFQNCGEINIKSPTKEPKITFGTMPLKTSMCSPKGFTFGAPIKFLFIVDMSMSNLGLLRTSINEIGGIRETSYCIDTGEANSACREDGDEVAIPTDLLGERFDAIKDFIDTCGGSNVEYGIIGFSREAHTVLGNTCLSPFQSSNDALVAVDALKAMQAQDYATKNGGTITGHSAEIPYNLKNATSYQVAVDCMKTKVEEDVLLLPLTEKPIYNIFFVTDGKTTDTEEIQNGYPGILQDLNLIVSESTATAVNLYPLFYKSLATPDAEVELATEKLDALATIVNPSIETVVISDFSSEDNPLCQQLEPGTEVEYELKHLYAVNISATRKGNQLLKDSDMDGIADEEEVRLGWDPLNPRSTGVYDSLCLRLSEDTANCLELLSTLECTNDSRGLGLSDCDLKFAEQVFARQLTLVDSDKDQMTDFIEINRGLNPGFDDSMSQPFLDGYSNFEKVIRGIDLHSSASLNPLVAAQMTQLDFDVSSGTCEDEGRNKYDFTLSQISLTDTLSYTDNLKAILDFSHAENENVILVFSFWRALGNLEFSHRLYVQKMKLTFEQDDYVLEERKYLGEF